MHCWHSLILLAASPSALAQFGGEPQNANPFVDTLITQVVNASQETILLEDEEFVVVVDLFIVRPELHLEVTGLEKHYFLFPCCSDLLNIEMIFDLFATWPWNWSVFFQPM